MSVEFLLLLRNFLFLVKTESHTSDGSALVAWSGTSLYQANN